MAKGCGPHYLPRKWLTKVIPSEVLDFFDEECSLHDTDYNTYQPKSVSDAEFLVRMWKKCETVEELVYRKYLKKWALRLYWLVRTPIISHISWYSKGK